MARTKTQPKPAKRATPVASPLPPREPALPLPSIITRTLRQVRSRQTRVNLLECLVLLLATLPALWLIKGTADWFFNLPWIVRFFLLIGDLVVIGYIIWRFGIQAWRKRLNQRTAALKVEKAMPQLRTGLISSVELAEDRSALKPGSNELVHRLIDSVAAKLTGPSVVKRVVSAARLKKWTKILVVVLLVVGAVGFLGGSKTSVLVQRILLATVPLPTQTIVVPITRDASIAVGSDVELAARAEGVIPRSGRVQIDYANGERQEITMPAVAEAPGKFAVTLRNVQQPFTYRVILNDGMGEEFDVEAKAPPLLASLTITQDYPAYTGLPAKKMETGNLELLAGSTVRLQGESTQALKGATLQLEGANAEVPMKVGGKAVSGSFQVPAEGLTGLSLVLVNNDNIASQENTVYRVELLRDAPPVVELAFPVGEELSIVPGVKPQLGYTVQDDFEIKEVALKYELTPPAAPGQDNPDVQTGAVPLKMPAEDANGRAVFQWDLATISPAPRVGSRIRYWIEATDRNDVTGPGIGESKRQSFLIVSPAAKEAELLEKLGIIANELEDVYNKQRKANEALDGAIRQNQP